MRGRDEGEGGGGSCGGRGTAACGGESAAPSKSRACSVRPEPLNGAQTSLCDRRTGARAELVTCTASCTAAMHATAREGGESNANGGRWR